MTWQLSFPRVSDPRECMSFYDLILEVHTTNSAKCYWSQRPTLVQCGRRLHKDVITCSWGVQPGSQLGGCLPRWSLPKHWFVTISPISLSIGYTIVRLQELSLIRPQFMITEAKISYTNMQYARNLINVFKSVKQAILSIRNKWIRKVKQLFLSYKSYVISHRTRHSQVIILQSLGFFQNSFLLTGSWL